MVAYYKHNIAHWMDGTEDLSHTAYRAYHVICQLIYLHEGPITLNEQGIAGRCKQKPSVFRRAIKELVDANKIRIVDGKIDNARAEDELVKINKRGRTGTKSDASGSHPDSTRPDLQGNQLKLHTPSGDDPPLDKTRKEITPPTPPSGVSEHWNEFKRAWGRTDCNSPGVREIFDALSPPDRQAAVAGIAAFRAEEAKLNRGALGARRYLTERRWESPKTERPALPEPHGPPEWLTMRNRLKQEFGADRYAAWLAALEWGGVDDRTLTLRAPTRFHANYVREHFNSQIRYAASPLGISAVNIVTGPLQ